jgi:F-type H+-transporting ATPase subunit delta
MTGVGNVYGEALYTLARDEGLSATILEQLKALDDSFRQEPDFLRLLSAPNLPKAERCRILDDSFRGRIEPYILNFLKILTEKGYARHFGDCCKAYRSLYNQDNSILVVTAVTAVPLNGQQRAALTEKLNRITGKHVELENKLDPAVLGGVRLDYDGKRVDDTVSHRLDAVRNMLNNTVL